MNRLRRAGRPLVILLFYLGIAILTTWPLITVMGSQLPGPSTDALLHYWNGWWVGEALSTGQSPYFTTHLFYPEGVSLVYHNMAWFTILPWLPLQLVLDGVVAYNLVFLINLALCGVAAFWLALRLTNSYPAALIGGVIYQAWPFRLSQLDHPNLVSTYWIPLFFLALLYLIERPSWRRALLTGFLLALVGYTRWQLLIPVALMTVLFVLLQMRPHWRSRRHWSLLLLAGIVGVLLLLPPMLMLVQSQLDTPATTENLLREGEEQVMQTDLLAYVTPPANHPLLRAQTEAAYDRYYPDRAEERRFPAYVGLVAFFLGSVALLWRRHESIPWLALALVVVGLALGQTVRLGGQFHSGVPTLYRLLEPLFVVRLIRVPDRFNLFLALPTAMLAALGASVLLAKIKRPWWRGTLVTALIGVTLLEYLAIPVATQPTELSPFYTQVESGEALLNLPIDPTKSKAYMFAQTVHGQPILHGHVSRLPPGAYAFIDNHPWLRVVRAESEMAPWLTDVSRQLASLRDAGVAYLVMHKDLIGSDRIAHWQRYLPFAPRFEDDSIVVYSTAPVSGQDYTLQTELSPGFGPVKTKVATRCVRPAEPVAAAVAWAAIQAPNSPYRVSLSLMSGEEAVLTETMPLSVDWPVESWPANSIAWAYYTLPIPTDMAAGSYELQLELLAPDGEPAPLSLGEMTVAEECAPDLPPEAVPLYARFGDQLRLLGYSRQRQGEQLRLTLYWQALQQPAENYKVFVHIFEPETGVPVAQDDSMPHRGGYPTRFWELGEIVVDNIPIYLQGAPAGTYGIAVGVYDPVTLERLPLFDGSGTPVPDGRLILPGETVEIKP